jgi:hypothetical protein
MGATQIFKGGFANIRQVRYNAVQLLTENAIWPGGMR